MSASLHSVKMLSQKCLLLVPLLLLLAWTTPTLSIQFLDWGDKCQIPKQGGEPLTEECDAGKGLVCTGEACECTYKQRYSYDPVSKECRRRVGKPCQHVEGTNVEETLKNLPFNVKCHANADCAQVSLPGMEDKISMCVCKEGFVPTKDFNGCIVPPPPMPVVEIFTAPKNKLTFRPPYYT